jgi:predicted SAM-dependent methyltransferase
MNFEKFQKLDFKYLNLGAQKNTHPNKNYLNYIGINPPGKFQNKIVDFKTGSLILHPDNNEETNNSSLKQLPFSIYHDIELPFPLPDNSVDRIHSEDCFEHIEIIKHPTILKELYRILKPGGLFRLAVPDYMNPKDRFCLEKGLDPRNNLHITLTTYNLLKPVLEDSPFNVKYLHYWKNENEFIQNNIDYTKGYIKRTPDNDERNKGDNKLYVTSLVCDLTK